MGYFKRFVLLTAKPRLINKALSWLLLTAGLGLLLAACGNEPQSATSVATTAATTASNAPATPTPPLPTPLPSPTSSPTIASATTQAATTAPVATTALPVTTIAAPPAPTTVATTVAASGTASQGQPVLQEYAVPRGSGPHDVAPAPDGTVWYTAQRSGELGRLDPATGQTRHIKLGAGSAPHGVIVGPDKAAWVTDGGLNAILRVDPATEKVERFDLPTNRPNANLNTAAFDGRGILWFTGQNGIYGRLDPQTGKIEVFDAPRGAGPYGITATPDGSIYYASLAGNHIAQIDLQTGQATVLEPPTQRQGARRVWSDSAGRIWVSEWNVGQLSMYDPKTKAWKQWKVPGNRPQAYAVYVDERDMVWLSDFGANALVRFDPTKEAFEVFNLPSPSAAVRQILGRPGEVWGAESGADKLIVVRTSQT